MIFFRSKDHTTASMASSRDYITREAVQRANEHLMGRVVYSNKEAPEDVFTRYNIERPTSQQITAAATAAMRKFRLEQV